MAWQGIPNDHTPDVIGDGDQKADLLARWPWLKKSAVITVPLAAVAVIATAAALLSGSHPASSAHIAVPSAHDHRSSTISSRMYDRVQADGTFAGGTVAGHIWRMAVQNVATASGQCQPAVTVNGTDADPIYPSRARATAVGDPAFLAPGASMPGAGFAFVRVPAGTTSVWLDPVTAGDVGLGLKPVTVTSCHERFRLVGFAYPLAAMLRMHDIFPASSSYTAPVTLSDPQPSLNDPQVDGVWQDTDVRHAQVTTATLTTGLAFGQRWSIRVAFGTAGDCFILGTGYIDDSVNARPETASMCGPVSTLQGPDTIMALGALGLGSPAYDGLGVGYAVSVSPGAVRLNAHLSDGSVLPVTPVAVAGRRYAAFFIPAPVYLTQVDLDNAAGQEIARVQDPLEYGYTQFQP